MKEKGLILVCILLTCFGSKIWEAFEWCRLYSTLRLL